MKRITALLLLLSLLAGCGAPNKRETRTVFAMDTVMTLTAYGAPSSTSSALDAAEAELSRLDRLLSVTDSGSEIAAINRSGSAVVCEETGALIGSALEASRLTAGAYDPTLGLISEAWGFHADIQHVPDPGLLSDLLSACGYERVSLDGESVKIGEGMALDLGGIAKGYAAERVLSVMENAGVDSAVISLGGNVGTLGQKPGGSWRVAVEDPDQSGEYAGILTLPGGMYAITSGAYERFFEADGRIYHHILDPKTGFPAESDLQSVTIVSSDGTLADALSTALFVMGFDGAVEFWNGHSDLFQMVLITADGMYVTPELEIESGRDVTVLEAAP